MGTSNCGKINIGPVSTGQAYLLVEDEEILLRIDYKKELKVHVSQLALHHDEALKLWQIEKLLERHKLIYQIDNFKDWQFGFQGQSL